MKVLCAAGVACLVLASVTLADPQADRANMQVFMRQKLEYSKALTEGIVLEKFEKISLNTVALRKMSQTNFWLQTTNLNYLTRMTNFQTELDKLYFAASERDLDRATRAYGEVLKSCVDCHHIVRKEQLGLPRWGSVER